MTNENYEVYLYVRKALLADLPLLANGELGWAMDTRDLYVGSGTENVRFTSNPSVPITGRVVIGESSRGILKDAGANFGKSYLYTINSANGTGNLTGRQIILTAGDTNTSYYTGFIVNPTGNARYDSVNNRTSWDILVKRVDGTYTDSGWGSATLYVSYTVV